MKYLMAAALMISAMNVNAWFFTGDDIQSMCNQPPEGAGSSVCLGYIAGVVDALGGTHFCLSKGVTVGQLRAIVKKYIDNNLERLHLDATVLTTLALKESFPCPPR
jgi:hypothetical protein